MQNRLTHALRLCAMLLISIGALYTLASLTPPDVKPSIVPEAKKRIESRVYQWPSGNNSQSPQVQSIVKGSTTHLEQMEIKAVTLPKNQSVESATNGKRETLIIIKEGKLSIIINNTTQEVGTGSIALILPGDSYSVKNAREESAVYYLLEYQGRSPVNLTRGKEEGGSFVVDWNKVEYREHDKGGRRDFFDRPTAVCDDFEMHVTNLNANTSSHAPHTHVVEEIILLVQGKINMHIDGQELETSVGDFAFVDSNIPHAATNTGSGQAIYYAFQWK